MSFETHFQFCTRQSGNLVTSNVRWHNKTQLTWKVWISCIQYLLNSSSFEHCVSSTSSRRENGAYNQTEWMWTFVLNCRNRQVKRQRCYRQFMLNLLWAKAMFLNGTDVPKKAEKMWTTGSPVTMWIDKNVTKIRELVQSDCQLTSRMIADDLGMRKETVRKILVQDLSMRHETWRRNKVTYVSLCAWTSQNISRR
jgi:hypothetical protein